MNNQEKWSFVSNQPTVRFAGLWMVFFALSILVRIPLFLSDHFHFDGDEAIIGIMAQELLAGKQFPIYFAGQNYGLSTFEVIPVALFEAIFGASIWSLRLGGLLLYSLGLVYIFKAISLHQLNNRIKWMLLVLVLMFPTWYLWGMMVRGGYLTAFVLAAMAYYYTVKPSKGNQTLIIIGILIGLLYESHVFILLAILPFIAAWFFKLPSLLKSGIIIGVSAVLTIGMVKYFGTNTDVAWEKPTLILDWQAQKTHFQGQKKGIVAGFSGLHYYGMNMERPLWWDILINSFLVLAAGFIVWASAKERFKELRIVVFIAVVVLLYLFMVSTVRLPAPRYWIGLFTGLLFWLFYFISKNKEHKVTLYVLVLLSFISVAGVGVANRFAFDWFDAGVNETKAFEAFYNKADELDVKAIYITDGMMQWKWNYLFGDKIPASGFYHKERLNKYVERVKSIYESNPKQVAIGGHLGMCLGINYLPGFNETYIEVSKKYFVNTNAKKEYIQHGYDENN